MSGARVLALTLALGLLLGMGTTRAIRRSAPAGAAGGVLQAVATGFSKPSAIVNAGDGRLFVVEQTGAIKVVSGGLVLPAAFLDVNSLVSCCNERGLLGLAFHPDYASNGFFYIDYTDGNGDVVVARYHVSADPDIADAASAAVLLTVPHPGYENHNGGELQFGPDGKLYIGVGDGGGVSVGDPGDNGQSLGTLLGKILRIDVDAGSPYAVPADNPFVSTPGALPEIWAYGLRNPWRFSFDRVTGDLYIGDVGQDLWEEIDLQPAASVGGEDYGWRLMEGRHCYNPPAVCNPGTLTSPIIEYAHGAGECAVTGGYRYRGSAEPGLMGMYVYGDFCSGRIWVAYKSGTLWTSLELVTAPFLVSSFGEDAAGELYVTDYFGGGMYRLTAPDTDGDGVADVTDNCVSAPNPGQENNDRNFINQHPLKSVDDLTLAYSDNLGDICDPDDDNDGIPDSVETAGPPCASASGPTDPLLADTDGDRVLDGAECALGSNPNNPASKPAIPSWAIDDPDRDTLPTTFEQSIGSNPANADTDGDGLNDGVDVKGYNTSPLVADTDGDGSSDACEVASLNVDTKVNSGDQGLLASEMVRVPPPPKLANMDLNKDGVINSGDQGLMASKVGKC